MTDDKLPRLPDFIIIGAMKSGTTSLYRWLGQQEGVSLTGNKEPAFFSDESVWQRGVEWYQSLLSAPSDKITGEASVEYTDPEKARTAANRIAQLVPQARLIFVMREPLDRMRSQYIHQVQRSRELRPFPAAVLGDDSYVGRSLYYTCLEPYLEAFSSDSLLLIRFEDLIQVDGTAWPQVLSFLTLPPSPRPPDAHRSTHDKPQYSPMLVRLWKSGWLRRLRMAPKPIRAVGKAFLLRESPKYGQLTETANEEVPRAVADRIWDDVSKLESFIGSAHLWNR